jgi:hypothetical protein
MEETTTKEQVTETIKVTSEKLLEVVKKLLHEGNIRKIKIQDKTGAVIFEFPMTFGVLGAIISAPLMILATLIVLAKEYTITVERIIEKKEKKSKDITTPEA